MSVYVDDMTVSNCEMKYGEGGSALFLLLVTCYCIRGMFDCTPPLSNPLSSEKTAYPQLTLRPGAALLFDMSLSLSNIATSVAVLRKQGITCSNPDPYTYHLGAICCITPILM